MPSRHVKLSTALYLDLEVHLCVGKPSSRCHNARARRARQRAVRPCRHTICLHFTHLHLSSLSLLTSKMFLEDSLDSLLEPALSGGWSLGSLRGTPSASLIGLAQLPSVPAATAQQPAGAVQQPAAAATSSALQPAVPAQPPHTHAGRAEREREEERARHREAQRRFRARQKVGRELSAVARVKLVVSAQQRGVPCR